MMTREIWIVAACLVFGTVLVLSLHERHYRERRWTILDSQLDGLHGRLRACERILTEARDS